MYIVVVATNAVFVILVGMWALSRIGMYGTSVTVGLVHCVPNVIV